MRKASPLLIALLLSSLAVPVSASQWTPEFAPDLISGKKIGAAIIENDFTGGISRMAMSAAGGNSFWCDVLGEAPCNKANELLYGDLVMPICESTAQENCVAGFSGSSGDGQFIDAEFLGYVDGKQIAENRKYGLPAAATAGKWKLQGLNHTGGTDTYLVSLDLKFYADVGKRADFRSAAILIAPYVEKSGGYSPVELKQQERDGVNSAQQVGPSPGCAWHGEGVCGAPSDFTIGHTFKLDLRITNKIGGWFSGRVTRPDIRVTRHSANSNNISITAEPVRIQRISYSTARERATPEYIKEFDKGDFYFALTPASSKNAFAAIYAMRGQMKDTSSGVTTSWYLETSGSKGNSCMSDTTRVNGIVTTNATAYQGTAPEFKRGFLDYKVAGMHYEPDGVTKSLGTYDLVMRSDVARCLYGLSKAPVSATITVAGDGDTRIATTVVGEKGGWLKLAAYGFTFSEKTIKVKISQAKRTTITCVTTAKPTKTKRVSGVNPKCPAGYKKR